MNRTMFLLLLPVATFWAYTEYWQFPLVLFWLCVLSALVCVARGVYVYRNDKLVGLVCIGVVLFQIMFLVVPRLLHSAG